MSLKSSVLIILVTGLLCVLTVFMVRTLSSTKNEIVFRSVTEKEYQAASPFSKKLIHKTCKLHLSSASKIRVNSKSLLTLNFKCHEKKKIYRTPVSICT